MAEFFLDSLSQWLNPKYIIEHGGLILVVLIVFAETGLPFGFFFPGDSLLFTAGLLCGMGILPDDVWVVLISITIAGILGNYTGYAFGAKAGRSLFKRDDSLIFKKKYLDMTESFFQRYGAMALVAGRFLPIIRTFAPILAGVARLDMKKFTFYNIVGCILWVFSFILAGFFLGREYGDWLLKYLEYVVVALIIVTIIPVIRTYLKEKKRLKKTADAKVEALKEDMEGNQPL